MNDAWAVIWVPPSSGAPASGRYVVYDNTHATYESARKWADDMSRVYWGWGRYDVLKIPGDKMGRMMEAAK